ncbi:MAG: hypothetical protein K0R09_714 [Clostridiales bacterium]|jgi:hypothetical protein|nr:hypothetical protein [Clostridiales bacterium]
MLDAKGLVLMQKENGILTDELGSYEIESGLELVYKAYVEQNTVKLFLTTDRDVEDDEYNEIYENYNIEGLERNRFKVEEIEEEYNPVWCIKFKFEEEHSIVEDKLNLAIGYHENEINRIYEEIKNKKEL